MKNEKIRVDRVSREVIEGKLLASLSDDAKVAIVCSEAELTTLIDALDIAHQEYGGVRDEDVYAAMRNDLEKLRKEAFGK